MDYRYVDENDKLYTLESLKALYEECVVDGQEYESFDYWLECCQSRNNGSLQEVFKVSDNIYKTRDGYYYSVSGMVAHDVNDSLSDIQYDKETELDEIANELGLLHTFDEMTTNYYCRIDHYNEEELIIQTMKCFEDLENHEELVNLVKLLADSTFFER